MAARAGVARERPREKQRDLSAKTEQSHVLAVMPQRPPRDASTDLQAGLLTQEHRQHLRVLPFASAHLPRSSQSGIQWLCRASTSLSQWRDRAGFSPASLFTLAASKMANEPANHVFNFQELGRKLGELVEPCQPESPLE